MSMDDSSSDKQNARRLANAFIVGNAVIWAAVIFVSAVVLEGTAHVREMTRVLGGGAITSIIVLGGVLRGSKWAR
jgi:hypothetical protein